MLKDSGLLWVVLFMILLMGGIGAIIKGLLSIGFFVLLGWAAIQLLEAMFSSPKSKTKNYTSQDKKKSGGDDSYTAGNVNRGFGNI